MATLSQALQAYVDEVKARIDAGNSTNGEISVLVSGATDFSGTPAASASFINEVTTYIQSASPLPEEMAILMATVNKTYSDGIHADILAGNKTPQEIATILTAATLSVNTEVDALNQIYIDKFDALNTAGTLTSKELALMVAALPVLQNQIDNKKLMIGLATGINNEIRNISNQAVPLLPFNPVGEIHYSDSYTYLNYCMSFYDETQERMYVVTQTSSVSGSQLDFGYYSEDRVYTVLREGVSPAYRFSGMFILPLSENSVSSTIKIVLLFYYDVFVSFITEDSPGTYNTYTSTLARTHLVFDKINKALVFMPDAISAVRLYGDGTTEAVTDYTVTDSATFESEFWGNTDFLQLRGTGTPIWQFGDYSDDTDMGNLTIVTIGHKYSLTIKGTSTIYPYQVPYIKMDINGTVGYNKIIFTPDTNFKQDSIKTEYNGNYCHVLDENNNIISKFYIKIPMLLTQVNGAQMATFEFNEPICFNKNNGHVVCRSAYENAFLAPSLTCMFIQLFY